MYVDAIELDNEIWCWYRDQDNELYLINEDAPYYCYRRNESEPTHTSLFGDPLSKQEFRTRRDFNQYVKKRKNLFESDISPVYKYLSDNFYTIEDKTVNIGFFDIEVDYDLENGKGFPKPDNPFGEINSVSLYDRRTDEYHLIMLHDPIDIDHEEGEVVNLHFCVTERQVLDTFFKLIKDIDILSAWFGDGFDIPYIIERCIIVYGESKGLSKLCRDGFYPRAYEKYDDYGNSYVHYNLVGRNHIDYMELYKNFTFGERASYNLDSIAETELKKRKLEYKGDLGDLYRTDPKTFFEYSLHDARLLKLLDDKNKFMNLCIEMTKESTTKFTDVFGSIRYLEYSIMNYCHFTREEKIILPDKNPDNVKESFPGAVVLETNANGYGWTSSIDLTSLYPSTIRSINISPETHLLQCVNTQEDFVKVVEQSTDVITLLSISDGQHIEMTGFEVYEMLREHDLTISAYGSIFDNRLGIIPEILGIWFEQRKDMKSKSKKYDKENNKKMSEYYDILQNLKKLSLNSLYGAISNPYSRFYSIFLAASVTTTGQIIEKYQTWKADQIMKSSID